MSGNKSEAIRVNVDPDTKAELERRAEREDVSVAHLVRKAIKALLAASLIALLIVPSSPAGFLNDSDGPRQGVPLSTVPYTVINQPCPAYQWGACYYSNTATIYLDPRARPNLKSFWHELGHHFDATVLTDTDRVDYLTLIGKRDMRWELNRPDGEEPSEWFAEDYRACALGERNRIGIGRYSHQLALTCSWLRQTF